MLLNNLVYDKDNVPGNIEIRGTVIAALSSTAHAEEQAEVHINFSDAVAFPGLINSHDHLDFNCFPSLANRVYASYTEWGADIHANNKETINAVLKIPAALRANWGVYKNLLAGVTTVVNHGDNLEIADPPITIMQDSQSLHSVKFERFWKFKLNNPFAKNKSCAIHVGEGTNKAANEEINELIRWNLFNRALIGIHGVAMEATQAAKFKALVWCPESNMFLLNTTADIRSLQQGTNILFGTDSTLTGDWDIWNHIKLARSLQQVTDEALFDMLTKTAAAVWNLNCGEIKTGRDADIVIVKNKKGLPYMDLFFQSTPEDILMVIHKGLPVLIDDSIFSELTDTGINRAVYFPVEYKGSVKYVLGDLPSILTSIQKYYPAALFPVKPVHYTNG